MRVQIATVSLALLLASCTPVGSLTSTAPVETEIAASTKARTHLAPFTASPTAMVAPTPSIWQIWFRGFSCEGMELCGEGAYPDSYYFSINSDGTELRRLEILSFPTPQIPDDAPPLPVAFATNPQISPDQSTLTYSAKDGDNYVLYTVDIVSGKATRLYETRKIQDYIFWIGLACWSPTGQTIDFLLHSRYGNENQPPVLYTIDRNGQNIYERFELPGLENSWFGACSPDGTELVLSIPGNTTVAENGLYVINRITGHSRQILSNFFASLVSTPNTKDQRGATSSTKFTRTGEKEFPLALQFMNATIGSSSTTIL